MKKFVYKISLYGLICFICYASVCIIANGSYSPIYNKFTSPKHESLVLGTSRAFMGINPSIINKKLNLKEKRVYNFAITEVQSSFSRVYFEAIKCKLKEDTKESLFIITVDPWSISIDTRSEIENEKYREDGSSLDKVKNINQNPNINYLIYNYSLSWGDLLVKKIKDEHPKRIPQANGWLKVDIQYDSLLFTKEIADKVVFFTSSKSINYTFSYVRYNYLIKIIEYLKERGSVYIVRIPVHSKIKQIENEYMPVFDSKMNFLAKKYNLKYFNEFNCNDYHYFDGHHLIAESANRFTSELACKIFEDK